MYSVRLLPRTSPRVFVRAVDRCETKLELPAAWAQVSYRYSYRLFPRACAYTLPHGSPLRRLRSSRTSLSLSFEALAQKLSTRGLGQVRSNAETVAFVDCRGGNHAKYQGCCDHIALLAAAVAISVSILNVWTTLFQRSHGFSTAFWIACRRLLISVTLIVQARLWGAQSEGRLPIGSDREAADACTSMAK